MEEETETMSINKIKSEIIDIAEKMLYGKIDLIEGCRNMTDIQGELNNLDDIFIEFKIVSSDTDYIPIGTVRNTCSPEYLKRIDKEKEDYLSLAKNDILSACKKVILALENDR